MRSFCVQTSDYFMPDTPSRKKMARLSLCIYTGMNFLKLLIVDDDQDDRELILQAIALVSMCIKHMIATNGKEAIDLLLQRSFIPDLILLDLNMPVMDGYQFLEYRQNEKSIAAIPVIVHTTASDLQTIKKTFDMGADGFAAKAQTMSALTDKISGILKAYSSNLEKKKIW
jgi:CheY-like chemotaxis protein